jgi:hypothetical protein
MQQCGYRAGGAQARSGQALLQGVTLLRSPHDELGRERPLRAGHGSRALAQFLPGHRDGRFPGEAIEGRDRGPLGGVGDGLGPVIHAVRAEVGDHLPR